MTELRIALGAMEFGTRIDEKTSFELLDAFVDAGGTWIDTANCYAFWQDPSGHGGQSEELLGRWFARRPGVRDRVKLATKVGCEPLWPGSFPEHTEGLTGKAIDAAVETSLRRLQTDHIDLYWAHRDDLNTPLEETVAAFGKHAAAGTIGRIGLSNYALWRVERARGLALQQGVMGPTALQLRYSYLQPRPFVRDQAHDHRFGWITDEVLDYADRNPEQDLFAYSPLMSGGYERADRPIQDAFDHPGTTRRLEALAKAAADLGVTRSEVVLAWLIGGTPSIIPIVGMSTPTYLTTALAGAHLTLPPETRTALDAAW
ncbi:aryl-alcohol dehydrogenase-like predicted oxidoreductase [Kribbella voronezhensis]|uniref:Aryl-alcohol dehydrogenase-like predicted oxidoreductase n=1 Tax=Kribbella voronezhensis TaxID=2512212 RepID=A0A4R7TC10_9ACTN|nr:aldo/keto reductase [Kribbella voronezhensis]TDU89601.1 aryl-alcohol dehydrogenase-like predicted oxidoreductase [Kribbella voronezhensis]